MIEIRENLTLSKKSQREVKFKDHVFFPLSLFPNIKNS